MCWMDFHNAILRCGFLCTLLIPALFVSILFYGNHAEGYHAPSLPPRAITPVYASRLSRHSIFLLLCYHTRAITLHHTRTSGYHTRHSSYFVVYLSPAITPPVLLHLVYTTTGAPHVPTYSSLFSPGVPSSDAPTFFTYWRMFGQLIRRMHYLVCVRNARPLLHRDTVGRYTLMHVAFEQ